jgi:hypothetical protein
MVDDQTVAVAVEIWKNPFPIGAGSDEVAVIQIRSHLNHKQVSCAPGPFSRDWNSSSQWQSERKDEEQSLTTCTIGWRMAASSLL